MRGTTCKKEAYAGTRIEKVKYYMTFIPCREHGICNNTTTTSTGDTWSNKFPFRKVCTRMTLPKIIVSILLSSSTRNRFNGNSILHNTINNICRNLLQVG